MYYLTDNHKLTSQTASDLHASPLITLRSATLTRGTSVEVLDARCRSWCSWDA